VKLVLPDALHARPANLLVRAASQLTVTVYVRKGDKRANAAQILEVLGLAAAKGETIELESEDADAVAKLAQLIELEFDPDLVPEHGTGAAAGIAIGEAIVLLDEDDEARPRGTDDEERARAASAFARAREELALVIASLPTHEAALFEPERTILSALEPAVLARIPAGASAEEAVRAEAVHGPSDLIDDARRRLLDALAGESGARAQRLRATVEREVVLVVEGVTPSLIASLPAHVSGVVAAMADEEAGSRSTGSTSHAAILARGRGLPLAYVPSHVAFAIEDGAMVILDTTQTPARIWPSPGEHKVEEARARREALRREQDEQNARAAAPLAIGTAVRVNVGSPREEVPTSADGIGLLRSELVFADRITAPSEGEQAAAYAAIAGKTTGPVNVRLFDAGGDKPLPFLPPPSDDEGARGVALLFANREALEAQLRAIDRARHAGDVRVLIPLVRDARDVQVVRAAAPAGVPIGAMIETPGAANAIDEIAAVSDFICIGTNDLASETLGLSREQGPDPLDPRVLAHVRSTVEGAHRAGRKVTVCGEVAADPNGARILIGLGVDGLSVAAAKFSTVKLSLADATLEACRAAATEALSPGRKPGDTRQGAEKEPK